MLEFENGIPVRKEKPSGDSNEEPRRSARPVSKRGSRADILKLIEETAYSTATLPGVRAVGLTKRHWHALFRANIQIESNYNPNAVSHAGAIGLGQLMPKTARQLGVNPHDPIENLIGSARYLSMMLQEFGSKELALAAYNAGPLAVSKYGGIPPFQETQNHVRKVMRVFRALI